MLKIPVQKLEELYASIAAERGLYLPVERGDCVEFARWAPGDTVRLDRLNTDTSAKGLFFSQSENIVAFRRRGKTFSIEDNRGAAEPFVLFGVRPCDARSFTLLDRVFLEDPVDTFYKARRENGLVVSLACRKPEETCFCRNFGVDASEPDSCDVAAWLAGDKVYWEALTEKGGAFTAEFRTFFQEADERDREAVNAEKKAAGTILENLPFGKLNLRGFDAAHELQKFNDPAWEKLSDACLGCGTCTFFCPTCQCFDICEFDTGNGIKRFRCWDSCMYSEFTRMSAGQPRPTQKERFRQRFMHKLVYFPARNGGVYACVGCGRCLKACPVSQHIVKVVKALGEDPA
jgi:formate hydrogenlyase subunit 6/NADH:ubiquinone oxidoreductase subunit I